MLSLTAAAGVAVPTREPSCTGALLSWQYGPAVARDRAMGTAVARQAAAQSAVRYPRPWVPGGASLIGASAQAGQAKFALLQLANQKYAHKTTRIAAAGGGALGPHPARDPV